MSVPAWVSALQMPRNPLLSAGRSEGDSGRGAGEELRDLLCPANRKLAAGSHAGRYGLPVRNVSLAANERDGGQDPLLVGDEPPVLDADVLP